MSFIQRLNTVARGGETRTSKSLFLLSLLLTFLSPLDNIELRPLQFQ